jgi:hypothetical protein
MSRGFLDEDDRDWRGRFGEEARRSDLVDLALHCHRETDAAFLLSDDGDERRAKWAPRSQVEPSGGTYTMPEWLAKDRGWL